MYADPLFLSALSIALLFLCVPLVFLLQRSQTLMISVSYSIIAFASACAALAGALSITHGTIAQAVIPLGLPELPFHVRIDPLAGFFLFVTGVLSLIVSIYSVGYVKGIARKRSVTALVIFHAVFVAGMLMVPLCNDALVFLICWEIMAVSSYFLVIFENERAENRRAAFLYIVMAHVGAIAILLCFGVLAGLTSGGGSFEGYTFESMRNSTFTPGWATVAFLLALFGFGAKAGLVPLHVWLPEAHPVAPSNISALMSGVMLKTAVYGMMRVTFDLIGEYPWWWGALLLVLGILSAILGVLYALMQNDIKKLLAYSSVENIGIIFIGIGMAMIFHAFHFPALAALAFVAAMYHIMNHAMFKGLLFMGAGAVVHATHERDLEYMGGLIHLMPWTAALFLVGCVSISALPPLNGFVSEWLTFQAFLLSPALPSSLMKLLMPLGAAVLALTGALAAATFVKVYGVAFLGRWRGSQTVSIKEVGGSMRTAMGLSAIACLGLGILPTTVIGWLDVLPQRYVGATLGSASGDFGWMWLTPLSSERTSYSGMIAFLSILAVVFLSYMLLHVRPGKIHRVPAWDCGFEKMKPTMQYTSTSFSMPFRTIFGFLMDIRERFDLTKQAAHAAFPVRLRYRFNVYDRLWAWLYRPIVDSSFFISRLTGKLQQGRINTYLLYSFITIIVLLVFVG